MGLGREEVDAPHVVGAVDGVVDDRAAPFFDVEVEAHAVERGGDVGEEDGRVHAELANGQERDLGGNLRQTDDLRQRVALADLAVLRLVAPGLAHHPYGSVGGGLATCGAQEGVVHANDFNRPRWESGKTAW